MMKRTSCIYTAYLVCSIAATMGFLVPACGGDKKDPIPDCTAGQSRCTGEVVEICQDGSWAAQEDCEEGGGTCGVTLGQAACHYPDPECTTGQSRCNDTVVEACEEGAWTPEEDCADTGAECVTGDGTAICEIPTVSPFEGMEVILDLGDSTLPVDLGTLDTTVFDGSEAIRLTRVVERAALELPWDNQYNFISSDGFDVMNDRYSGDASQLPHYGELDHGYLIITENDGLRVFWDTVVSVPGALRVKFMDGGTIQLVPFSETELLVFAGGLRARLDLNVLPTEDVVDYKYPEDPAAPMVPMAALFEAAGLVDPEAYAYKIYGNDGFSNNDTNLMPYVNATHAWINPANRRISFAEEAWDTTECCWRVRDTILVLGRLAE